jgi:hypothetical protein
MIPWISLVFVIISPFVFLILLIFLLILVRFARSLSILFIFFQRTSFLIHWAFVWFFGFCLVWFHFVCLYFTDFGPYFLANKKIVTDKWYSKNWDYKGAHTNEIENTGKVLKIIIK